MFKGCYDVNCLLMLSRSFRFYPYFIVLLSFGFSFLGTCKMTLIGY